MEKNNFKWHALGYSMDNSKFLKTIYASDPPLKRQHYSSDPPPPHYPWKNISESAHDAGAGGGHVLLNYAIFLECLLYSKYIMQ